MENEICGSPAKLNLSTYSAIYINQSGKDKQ